MPKIRYQTFKFSAGTLDIISKANVIIAEYAAQGFDLTLRQLYYQFVSRGYIVNKDTEYKRLGSIINDARLGGLIDWNAIVDRTRNLRSMAHWDTPADIVQACASQFRVDMWANQLWRPEVWIEKDALVGVIEAVCNRWDVPHFSCRGYTSQSEMWAASQRLMEHWRQKQKPVIFHLGDHDPSGIDMSRDIRDRLATFMYGKPPRFERLALNMAQVEQYNPPPNPAKVTDSRSDSYIAIHGGESWELDALDPTTLAALITDAIAGIRDDDLWDVKVAERDRGRGELRGIGNNWGAVMDVVGIGVDDSDAEGDADAEEDGEDEDDS